MSRRQVMAEVEGLSRHDRDAVDAAVSQGRAVEEERLAPLAARLAVARRERLADLCFGILGPLVLVGWGVLAWLVEDDDSEGWELAVTFGGWAVIGVLVLVVRRVLWRPLVRAERANLAAGGKAPDLSHVASGWRRAWSGALVIAVLLGLVLRPLGVSLGPVGIVLWWLLVLAVRLIDRRAFRGR